MDRRPREPRQLAGEYGSSEHWEKRFDAAELPLERLLDTDADAVRSGVTLDDVADADRPATDVAFKPKCLGIKTSIEIDPAHAERRSQVQSEHVTPAQSKSFDWFTHNVQRKLPRGLADKRFNLVHEFGWHAKKERCPRCRGSADRADAASQFGLLAWFES